MGRIKRNLARKTEKHHSQKHRKKILFKYKQEELTAALQEAREGKESIRRTAAKYGIPHSTLLNKLKNKVPLERKMGPSTYLTEGEENLLVSWIFACAKKGFPIKRSTLCDTVKDILSDDTTGRKTPFVDNRPGRKWFESFLKRHQDVSERHAESINLARAAVTEEKIKSWFNELSQYLKEENALDILDDSTRLYNADETGFHTCPKTGKVLGPMSYENFYEIKTGNEKEALTVMAAFSAAGVTVPPMIVYPLQKISREISANLNETWGIGRSKRGWMTGALYFEYIANIFLPWLKENNIQFPVLLLVDGHRSHVTFKVSQFCKVNGILQFALYPNATHILQPADVSVFRPLKAGWSNAVYEWKQKSGNKIVSKVTFGVLLEDVFKEKATPETIQNGFRKCGLFPFNPEAVDYRRCMSDITRQCPPHSTSSEGLAKPARFGVEHLLYVESLMKRGRAEEFRASEISGWQGDPEAKELFEVWKVMRSRCRPISSGNESVLSNEPSLETSETCASNCRISLQVPQTPPREVETLDQIPVITDASPKSTELTVSPATADGSADDNHSTNDNVQGNPKDSTCNTPLLSSTICGKFRSGKNISPAFANHIIWPTESPVKKIKKTQSLPHATTSKRWLEYSEMKEKEKQDKELAKLERKKKRESAKVEKVKPKPQLVKKNECKTISAPKENTEYQKPPDTSTKGRRKRKTAPLSSSESEQSWNESGDSLDDISLVSSSEDEDGTRKECDRLSKGDFVLVKFVSEKKCAYSFVCIVQDIDGDDVEVMGLTLCNTEGTIFKANEKDISTVHCTAVLEKLPTPIMNVSGERVRYEFKDAIKVGKIDCI